jgi:hypothetical protein
MYQVAEDDFRMKRDGKKTKEISTPRIKDAQWWRELQQDISTGLAADARMTTHETLQGKMDTEEGRKEVLSRRQEASERKLAKTESPQPQREVSRAPHKIILLKEIQQLKAALRHDEDEEWVTMAQKRCIEEFDLEEETLLSQGERAKLVRTRE